MLLEAETVPFRRATALIRVEVSSSAKLIVYPLRGIIASHNEMLKPAHYAAFLNYSYYLIIVSIDS